MSEETGEGRCSHVRVWSWNIVGVWEWFAYIVWFSTSDILAWQSNLWNLECRRQLQFVRSVLVPIFMKSLPVTILYSLLSSLNYAGQFRFCPGMIWNGWRLRSVICLLGWIRNVFPILVPISYCIHLYNSLGVIYSVKLQYKSVPDNASSGNMTQIYTIRTPSNY